MPVRVVRLQSRNPIVAAALLLLVLALVLVAVVFGLTLLAGVAALGGAAYLVRRLAGRPVLGPPVAGPRPAIERLDPTREVFATAREQEGEDGRRRLPPAAGHGPA